MILPWLAGSALKAFIWLSARPSPRMAISRMAAPIKSSAVSPAPGLSAAAAMEAHSSVVAGAWTMARPNRLAWKRRPHSSFIIT
jgi:hypothetical protein